MLFVKQPLILPFFSHKSVTTCHIDSTKASNSKFKPDICRCVKAGTEPKLHSSNTNETKFSLNNGFVRP